MRKSPLIYPKDKMEHGRCCAHEFDPEEDFVKFLEEAKRYAKDNKPSSFEQSCSKNEQPRLNETNEKRRRHNKSKSSWKNAIFPFRRGDRKSGSAEMPVLFDSSRCPANLSKPGGANSGPVYRRNNNNNNNNNVGLATACRKGWKSASGPIMANLFGSNTKKGAAYVVMENEIETATPPYTSHGKVDGRSSDHAYGPLYFVT